MMEALVDTNRRWSAARRWGIILLVPNAANYTYGWLGELGE